MTRSASASGDSQAELNELRRFGRFIGLVDAGEILDLAGQRLLVQALGIAGDRRLERRIESISSPGVPNFCESR
jgi:hypothetical protein